MQSQVWRRWGRSCRACWSQTWAVGVKPWAGAAYWGHGGAAGVWSFRNLSGHLFGSKLQVLVLGESVLHCYPSSRECSVLKHSEGLGPFLPALA